MYIVCLVSIQLTFFLNCASLCTGNFLVFLVAAPPEAWWALSFLPSHASPSWLEIHALAARIVGYSRPSQMCMLAVQCTIKQCWLRLRSSVCAQ